MKHKFLINCSFTYYLKNYAHTKENFALIIEHNINVEDFRPTILEGLRQLGFDLKDFKPMENIKSFTVQRF